MLVEFQLPTGNRTVAFEADEVSDLHASLVPNVTEVFLRNGRRYLVAGAYEEVLKQVRAARSDRR